jgi:hypothetical protein
MKNQSEGNEAKALAARKICCLTGNHGGLVF